MPAPPPRPVNPTRKQRFEFLLEDCKKRMDKTGFLFHPLKIDDEKPLHMHLVFWLPILIFVSLGIGLTIPFWCFCWPSPLDYDVLLKQLGFPVFIASIALPITVAIGRFHGSKQRARANKLNEINIAFNHYFDHRQYFFDYLDKTAIPEMYRGLITVEDPDIVYSLFFPHNKINRQDFTIKKDVFENTLKKMTDKLFTHVNKWVIAVQENRESDNFSAFEDFYCTMPKMFGFRFNKTTSKAFADYADNTDITFFSFCFEGIRDTLQSIQSFNHVQRRGWSVVLAFQPFIDSLKHNRDLIKADVRATEIIMAMCVSDALESESN
ncbi:MAG: hypothetical protein AAGB12_16935 [Pseudomonadota bacterium]